MTRKGKKKYPMHYKIADGIIESELAAKSIRQPNRLVIEFIQSLSPSEVVLDYGCGKLRYTIPLANQVKTVVAIDSIEQLSKRQIIADEFTTLLEYRRDNVIICPIDSGEWRNLKYDTILCTNVLSAIPDHQERRQILKNIKSVIKQNGIIFFSTQYRNSYFKTYDNRIDIQKYNDGWLMPRAKNKYCFYAPLNAKAITTLCVEEGLHVIRTYKRDGSCFIIATCSTAT